MSSLKFSYWSSPHTSTKSGLKSSRILRIARKSLPKRSPQRLAAERPSSLPSSANSSDGQFAGSFTAGSTFGASSTRLKTPVSPSFGRQSVGQCVHPNPRISAISVPPLSGLRRENLITRGNDHPGLLAARPEMRGRLQPRGVVERAASNPPDHLSRCCTGLRAADDPAAAFRAQPSCDRAAAVRDLLRQPRLTLRQPERAVGYRDRERERAARQVLTVGAVTRVDRQRRLADFIAQRAAQAAAGQGKLHRAAAHAQLGALANRGMSPSRCSHGQARSRKISRPGFAICGSSNVPTFRTIMPGRRAVSSAIDEPHSGQKWRNSGLPLPPGLLNVFSVPLIVSASFCTGTSAANALPVNFWQSRQWHTVTPVGSASAL